MKINRLTAWWAIGLGVCLATLEARSLEIKFAPDLVLSQNKTIRYTTKDRGQLMLTKAKINGVEGTFIVDTGCSHSVISEAMLQRLKLGEQTRTIQTAGNVSNNRQKLVRINTLAVSGNKFSDFDALIISLAHFTKPLGQEISGFIGSNLLSASPYTIRLRDQTIVFGTPEKPEAGVKARMLLITGRPGFEMTVNKREKVKFIIDSGATESIMPKALYQGESVKRQGPVEVDINKNQGSRMREYAQPDTMIIGGEKVEAIALKLTTSQNVGLLGADFLKHYNIFVDTDQRVLRFARIKTE